MSFHYSDLWLMEPAAMRQFQTLTRVEVTPEAAERYRESRTPRKQQSVAVIPIHGPIEARGSLIGEMLGMTSYEAVGNAFDQVMADDSVAGVVLDVASPGGMVYGAQELANKVYSARGAKPIIAVANPMAASGAYWIAAAADRVIASPSSDVGSVGVIMSRFDTSAALEKDGVKEHVIRSAGSPYKGEFIESEPMTDEARDNFQARADAIYDLFVGDLAKFRGVSVAHVREHFGKGRLVGTDAAMKAGMIDRVDTYQNTVVKLASGRLKLRSEAAQDEWDAPTVAEAFRNRVRERQASLSAMVEN